jgi:histidinol dehydrogenase
MKIISVRNIDKFVDQRRPKQLPQNKKIVESILFAVKKKGDSAVKRYEKRFNGVNVGVLRVSKKEFVYAYSQVTEEEISAIKAAKNRLEKTELALKKQLKKMILKTDGVKITKYFSPIDSVGCYVPGGLARYPSSLIMSVVPVKVAGVPRTVAVSPPNKDGKIDSITLVAADICGVDEFYKTGGAQAIAALSYGTKSITKVDKIVGPGGSFVTLAKFLVSDTTPIDMIAGPTELCIIADDPRDSELVATDLISQAEHSPDTFCCAITSSLKVAKNIKESITQKINKVKRSSIIKRSLADNGFIAVCKNQNDIIKLANKLAPEHLEIFSKNARTLSSKITTSGLTLLGKNTPSSASDYLMGSNHILPTQGFGKTRGSLSVLDFMKINTEIESSQAALYKISNYMKALTSAEGLPNHFEAVKSRLK